MILTYVCRAGLGEIISGGKIGSRSLGGGSGNRGGQGHREESEKDRKLHLVVFFW